MPKVNLDALIARENLDIRSKNKTGHGVRNPVISINELKFDNATFTSLRKPDFQRVTSEWDPEKVCGLIDSFIKADTIPAVILWQSPSRYRFIIDGSHRLSALAAWVNNDYGDGEKSKLFTDEISKTQLKFAEETRELVNSTIGEFKDYADIKSKKHSNSSFALKARQLFQIGVPVQYLEADSGKSAENTFLKINREPVKINDTELTLIECRNKPNAIATRAIVNSGTGHEYWSKFSKVKKNTIKILSKQINEMLFLPSLENKTVKTLDLPIAGKLYSEQTLLLIFDLVNNINGVTIRKKKKGKGLNKKIEVLVNDIELKDDKRGNDTIKYLKKCKKIIKRINSKDPSSLGLHPAVYFYSSQGQHKPASFHSIVALIMDFERNSWYRKFYDIREKFERFLILNDDLVQQIGRKYRSAANGVSKIKGFYSLVLDIIGVEPAKKLKNKTIVAKIRENENYSYLRIAKVPDDTEAEDFDAARISEAVISEKLRGEIKCKYCHGYMHTKSISGDHIVKKREGGKGKRGNLQLAHPYCNAINN
ncbi:MAG: DUF262 domain-containing protein [Bacteroidota bacterium]